MRIRRGPFTVPENPVNQTLPGAAWEEDSHNPVGQGGRVTRLTVHVDKLRFGDTQPRRGPWSCPLTPGSACAKSSGGVPGQWGQSFSFSPSRSDPPLLSPLPLPCSKPTLRPTPKGRGRSQGCRDSGTWGQLRSRPLPTEGRTWPWPAAQGPVLLSSVTGLYLLTTCGHRAGLQHDTLILQMGKLRFSGVKSLAQTLSQYQNPQGHCLLGPHKVPRPVGRCLPTLQSPP